MTGATLPPWTARNERERRMMHDWVNARLNEENQAEAERRIGDADLDAPLSPACHRARACGEIQQMAAGGRTRTGGGGTRRH